MKIHDGEVEIKLNCRYPYLMILLGQVFSLLLICIETVGFVIHLYTLVSSQMFPRYILVPFLLHSTFFKNKLETRWLIKWEDCRSVIIFSRTLKPWKVQFVLCIYLVSRYFTNTLNLFTRYINISIQPRAINVTVTVPYTQRLKYLLYLMIYNMIYKIFPWVYFLLIHSSRAFKIWLNFQTNINHYPTHKHCILSVEK